MEKHEALVLLWPRWSNQLLLNYYYGKRGALVLLWPRWSNQRQIKTYKTLSLMLCGTGVVWPIEVES